MRILYIALSCGPNLGSEDAVGWNISLEAARLGHDVTVLTRSDKRGEIECYISSHPDMTYPSFMYRSLSWISALCKGPFYSIRAKLWCNAVSKELNTVCREGRYDVIHQITPVEYRAVVDMTDVNALRIVGPLGGGGDISPIFTRSYLGMRDKLVERLRAFMNLSVIRGERTRRALCSHDVVLAANHETAEAIRSMGWVREIPIRSEVAVKRISQDSLDAHEGVVIGAAGRLHYRKGYLFLLDVLARIEDDAVRLKVAGDGPQREIIEDRIRQLGLEDRVELLGRVPYREMEDFYRSIDIFAFPSFRETTGTVLVEAMAAGVPTVAFDAFGAHEVLEGSPQSLVRIEDNLDATIEAFSIAMLRQARDHSSGTHSKPQTWRRYVEDLVKLYEDRGAAC